MARNSLRNPALPRSTTGKKNVPALPVSIWRKIVAEMPSVADKADLCSLSLVSATLREAAQAQLFGTITMSDRRDEQWMAFVTLLSGNHLVKPRAKEKNPPKDEVDGPDFHGKGSWSGWDIMDDMTYRMIRTIEKNRKLGRLVKSVYLTGIADGNASYAAMRKILEVCPDVVEITVLALVRPRDDQKRQVSEGESMPRVTKAIVDVNLRSLRELALINYGPAETFKASVDLVNLPSLEKLAFDPTAFAPHLVDLPPLQCRLTSFHTQSKYAYWLLPFCTSNSYETLKTLRIDLREESVFLDSYTSLEKLELGFKYRENLDMALRSLPSDSDATIRSLTLAKARMEDDEALEDSFHRVEWDTIFYGIPESIETLIIEYPLSRDGFGTFFGLKAGLSAEQWPNLKSIDMRLQERGSEAGGSEVDYNVGSSGSDEFDTEEADSEEIEDSDDSGINGPEEDEETEGDLSEEGEEALEAELRIAEQLLEDADLSDVASLEEEDSQSEGDNNSSATKNESEDDEDEEEESESDDPVDILGKEKRASQKRYRKLPKLRRLTLMQAKLDCLCADRGIELHWDRYI